MDNFDMLSSFPKAFVLLTKHGEIKKMNKAFAEEFTDINDPVLLSEFKQFAWPADKTSILIYRENSYLCTCSGEEENVIMMLERRQKISHQQNKPRTFEDYKNILTSLANRFINMKISNIDQGIQEALSQVGQYENAARCTIFEYKKSYSQLSSLYEWCQPGIASRKEELQNLRVGDFPWLHKRVEQYGFFVISNVDELPADAGSERNIFKQLKIASAIATALYFEGKLFGLIVFSYVSKKKGLTFEAIDALKITGQTILNAIIRKRAEEELRLYVKIFDSASDGIVIASVAEEDQPIIHANAAFLHITGYELAEVLGKNCRFLQGKDSSEETRQTLHTAIKKKESVHQIIKNYKKNGDYFWNSLSISPVSNENGVLTHYIGIITDITERIDAQMALQETEKRLELFFKQSLDGFFFMMLPQPIDWNNKQKEEENLDYAFHNQRMTQVNKALLDIFGSSEEEFLGLTPADFYKNDPNYGKASWKNLFDKGGLHLEIKLPRFDGSHVVTEGDYTVIKNEKGEIIGHFGILRDVTAKADALQSLKQSEERFRQLAENIEQMFWLRDERKLLYVSPAFETIYGMSRSAIKKDTDVLLQCIYPEDEKIILNKLLAYRQNIDISLRETFRIVRPNGQVRWVTMRSFPVKDEAGITVRSAGILQDITKEHEIELKNKELLEGILDDLNTAAKTQAFLLPSGIKFFDNYAFSSFYRNSTKVGGDLFDVSLLKDDKLLLYMGDISGHGIQAALLMTAIKSLIDMLVQQVDTLDPRLLAKKLNEILLQQLFAQGNYLTIILGVIDKKANTFSYLNAGHPPLIEYNTATKTARIVRDKGAIPLGWLKNHDYEKEELNTISLTEDKIFLLYTDGIFECENAQEEQLGIKGLVKLINSGIDEENCFILPQKIKMELDNLGYSLGHDDFSLLALQQYPLHLRQIARKQKIWHLGHNLAKVAKAGKEADAITLRWTKDKNLAMKAELIINEFLNNILIHGMNESSEIILILSLTEMLNLIFIDTGIAWDFTIAALPKFDKPRPPLTQSGRGMAIIMSLSSSFERYRYENANYTVFKVAYRD